MFEDFVQVFVGGPACFRQIHEGEVAAIAWRGSGYITVETGYERESAAQQRQYVRRLEISLQYQIVAGAAAHRTPVDHARHPFRVVAQKSGGQVFDGVERLRTQSRFTVGHRHAYIERGECIA